MHRAMHGGGCQHHRRLCPMRLVTIEIRDFDYFPRELTVAAGTSLTWVNGTARRTTPPDEAGDGERGTESGESATLTFDAPGSIGTSAPSTPT
jgi:plastocyanin